ncbi:ABC transporter permease [Falsigemmobacter intermedius]|uniref:ABC transporter permease subunit n=1 Tax=Falsigemmobacter intermedius TaxID=1553448 RepID=A0A3S3UW93_9RHOB|nr:ABC transporter permease subunit [Falsigemmobacter intermedius]RWY41435.1 ABC transporter permease subunit [Falsigemmobacter intermedius]
MAEPVTATPFIIREENTSQAPADLVIERRRLTVFERLWSIGALRKALILIAIALFWEGYARWADNELLFPTFTATLQAMAEGISNGKLLTATWGSLKLLLVGYFGGIILAALMSVAAISTKIGNDILETMTAMFNPLPAIALLPLALLWFGLGMGSIIFVLIHSVLWPVALNTHSGFTAVSPTLRMVGRNYGLRGLPLVFKVMIPAAFPSILAGLKIGWAFAWRTLIAAELVFGATAGGGGLGWYVFENKNILEIPSVFAGLLSVIIVGLVIDNFVFRVIERRTIARWGMSHG